MASTYTHCAVHAVRPVRSGTLSAWCKASWYGLSSTANSKSPCFYIRAFREGYSNQLTGNLRLNLDYGRSLDSAHGAYVHRNGLLMGTLTGTGAGGAAERIWFCELHPASHTADRIVEPAELGKMGRTKRNTFRILSQVHGSVTPDGLMA